MGHVLLAEECNVMFDMRRPLCSLHRKVLSEALSVSPGKKKTGATIIIQGPPYTAKNLEGLKDQEPCPQGEA